MIKKYINPNSLHPTQFCLGYKEVEHKEKNILKMSEKEYSDYLIEKITPVIIGPKNTLYLIDHHHHARSLINLNKPEIYIEIIQDYSQYSQKSFIKAMIDNGYTNLLNENNQKMPFSKLPESLTNMTHDYFRSLAWSVREKGGFKKMDQIPFFEFRWGEFFRKYITAELIKEQFELATKVGLQISSSPQAKHLPGYIGEK